MCVLGAGSGVVLRGFGVGTGSGSGTCGSGGGGAAVVGTGGGEIAASATVAGATRASCANPTAVATATRAVAATVRPATLAGWVLRLPRRARTPSIARVSQAPRRPMTGIVAGWRPLSAAPPVAPRAALAASSVAPVPTNAVDALSASAMNASRVRVVAQREHSSRCSSTRCRGPEASLPREYAPRRSRTHWHSGSSPRRRTWACSQAVRRPSLARRQSADAAFGVRPAVRANSASDWPSTWVIHRASCQRRGRREKAASMVATSAIAVLVRSGSETSSPSRAGSMANSRLPRRQFRATLRTAVAR